MSAISTSDFIASPVFPAMSACGPDLMFYKVSANDVIHNNNRRVSDFLRMVEPLLV
jgi:hypothetical protein